MVSKPIVLYLKKVWKSILILLEKIDYSSRDLGNLNDLNLFFRDLEFPDKNLIISDPYSANSYYEVNVESKNLKQEKKPSSLKDRDIVFVRVRVSQRKINSEYIVNSFLVYRNEEGKLVDMQILYNLYDSITNTMTEFEQFATLYIYRKSLSDKYCKDEIQYLTPIVEFIKDFFTKEKNGKINPDYSQLKLIDQDDFIVFHWVYGRGLIYPQRNKDGKLVMVID